MIRRVPQMVFQRVLNRKVLLFIGVPLGLLCLSGMALALNAIMNPPRGMTGSEMLRKFMIDGFRRGDELQFQRDRAFLVFLRERSIEGIGFGGYAGDELALQKHPTQAYRSQGRSFTDQPRGRTGGPLPFLERDIPFQKVAAAFALPQGPGSSILVDESRFFDRDFPELPEANPEIDFRLRRDSADGPRLQFVTKRKDRQDTSGPRVEFVVRRGDDSPEDEDQQETSPVPLPGSLWLMVSAFAGLVGLPRLLHGRGMLDHSPIGRQRA